MKLARKCFACGQPATGDDHVPPKSFFPKQRDLPAGTVDVRRNLITVPAYDTHNSRFSKDDEVASLVILLTHRANQLGVQQFLSKGLRGIAGRRGLVRAVFKRIEVYQLADGREIPIMEFDAARVDRVMDRVARGLFFHDFGRSWECDLRLLADGAFMQDLSPSPHRQFVRQLEPLFAHSPRKGSNPSVFWYDWVAGVKGDCSHLLRMCFYDGLRYYAVPFEKGTALRGRPTSACT